VLALTCPRCGIEVGGGKLNSSVLSLFHKNWLI